MSDEFKPWLIMTGASRGLGQALAVELQTRGISVCALGRKQNLSVGRSGVDAVLPWDCAKPWEQNNCADVFQFATQNRVLGFIHGAGILGPMDNAPAAVEGDAWKRWWDEYQNTLQINSYSGAQLAHALIPFLKSAEISQTQRRVPFVMHVSSGAALKPYAGWNAYCASKAAILMEFKCMAAQHHPDDLLCLSVAPGTVMTDMMKQVLSADEKSFPSLGKFKELEKKGGLVPPSDAARKMVGWLMDTPHAELSRWHGEFYDVRSSS